MPDPKDNGAVEVPAAALDALTLDLRRLHTRHQRIATDLRLASEEVARLRLTWTHRTDDPAPSDQHPTFPHPDTVYDALVTTGFYPPVDPHD